MHISIAGQHISIGSSLKEHVEERAQNTVRKYFEKAISINVRFNKEGYRYHCELLLNDGTGRHIVIRSDAESDEIYSSFDMALTKLEKQLRKHKSRLKEHDRTKLSENSFLAATKYTLNPYKEHEAEEVEDLTDQPAIIAEKPTAILNLSVNEAVMKMDLENLPALMFKNSKSGRTNIVYYRRDGNIAWVESE